MNIEGKRGGEKQFKNTFLSSIEFQNHLKMRKIVNPEKHTGDLLAMMREDGGKYFKVEDAKNLDKSISHWKMNKIPEELYPVFDRKLNMIFWTAPTEHSKVLNILYKIHNPHNDFEVGKTYGANWISDNLGWYVSSTGDLVHADNFPGEDKDSRKKISISKKEKDALSYITGKAPDSF